MCKTLWCAALVGAGIIGAAGLHAAAQPGADGEPGLLARLHGHHAAMFTRLHAEANITDEQKTAIHQVFRERSAEIEAAMRPVLEARRTLHQAILADQADEAAIRDAGAALGRAIADAGVALVPIKQQIIERARLTPEQVQKFRDMHAQMDGQMDGQTDGSIHDLFREFHGQQEHEPR